MGRLDREAAQIRDRLIAARQACVDAAQRDKTLLPVIHSIDRTLEDLLRDQRAMS